LEDKNELESLLQDAKDLDLDLIEDNLSAVDMRDALNTLQEAPLERTRTPTRSSSNNNNQHQQQQH